MIELKTPADVASNIKIYNCCYSKFLNHLTAIYSVAIAKNEYDETPEDSVKFDEVFKQLATDLASKSWYDEQLKHVYYDVENDAVVFITKEYAYFIRLYWTSLNNLRGPYDYDGSKPKVSPVCSPRVIKQQIAKPY